MQPMSLLSRFFYKKPPDGLLEFIERVYVFDSCFSTDVLPDGLYRNYLHEILSELHENFPDSLFLAFNFREGEKRSFFAETLSDYYDVTILDYPRQYEGCPLLPLSVTQHFLWVCESWILSGERNNVVLLHCERGGWPLLAFMLASFLIFRRLHSGERRTLEMVHREAPKGLLQLLSPLNPLPSQLRYLQYVARRKISSEWPPLERSLSLDCVILRGIPHFDSYNGCRPLIRIFGRNPCSKKGLSTQMLFSMSKKNKNIRYYRQVDCDIIKIDIQCLLQGDVVFECVHIDADLEREVMMFRVMFNTSFLRSNILMLNCENLDILWDSKERYPKGFRAEFLFGEEENIFPENVPVTVTSAESIGGLPIEAFSSVQELFSGLDWSDGSDDATLSLFRKLSMFGDEMPKFPFRASSTSSPIDSEEENNLSSTAESHDSFLSPEESDGMNDRMCPRTLAGSVPSDATEMEFYERSVHPIEGTVHHPSNHPMLFFSGEAESFLHPSEFPYVPLPSLTPEVPSCSLLVTQPLTGSTTFPNPSSEAYLPDHFLSCSPPHVSSVICELTSQSQFSRSSSLVPGSNVRNSAAPPQSSDLCPPSVDLVDSMMTCQEISAPLKSSTPLSKSSFHDSNLLPTFLPPVSQNMDLKLFLPDHTSYAVATGSNSPPPSVKLPPPLLSSSKPPSPPPPPPPCSKPPPPPPLSSVKLPPPSSKPPPPPPSILKPPIPIPPPPPLPGSKLPSPLDSRKSSLLAPPIPPPLPGSKLPPPLGSKQSSLLTPPIPLLSPIRPQMPSPVKKPPPPPPPPPFPPSLKPPPPPPPPPPFPPCLKPPPPPPPFPPSSKPPPPPPPPSLKPPIPPPPPPPPPPLPASKLPPPPPLGSKQSSLLTPPIPPVPSIRPQMPSAKKPSMPPPPQGQNRFIASHIQGPPSLSILPQDAGTVSRPPPPPTVNGFNAPPPPPSTEKGFNAPPPPPSVGKGRASGPENRGKGPGTVGTLETPRKALLKPLHWVKVSRAVKGSWWTDSKQDSQTRGPDIDISELTTLFSAASVSDGSGGGRVRRGSKPNKPEKIQLVDLRRAYNCEIMLTKIKIPLPDMNAVLNLDSTLLDIDQVENLIKFCPTKEEMETLKGYTGEKEMLGKCERFFLELMKVPRIESKLRVFAFTITFSSQVRDLRMDLNTVNSSAHEVKDSPKFRQIMQTILTLGNALNQGTVRGSAVGFKLDSLLKLSDTRARNNKTTLMHYLCKLLGEKMPHLADFDKDLVHLEAASKIQLKSLAEEMQAVSKGLEKVEQELTAAAENDGSISSSFQNVLKHFLDDAEATVRQLISLYTEVGRNADSLCQYFGEDPARCPFEQVTQVLFIFTKTFKKCRDENDKLADAERKRIEKERLSSNP